MSRLTLYSYDLSGNIVQKGQANGLKEVRSHDGRNRVSTLDNQTAGDSDVAGYAYQYDRSGNVMEVVEDYASGELSGRTITNGYDGVYRLTSEAIVTGAATVTTAYGYDQGHNRTSQAVTDGSGTTTTTYTIGDGSNGAGANQVIGDGTVSYDYDANGNRRSRTVPALTQVGYTVVDSATVSLISLTGVNVGMVASGPGLPAGASVVSIDATDGTITLSLAATATGLGITVTFSNQDLYGYDDENRLTALTYLSGESDTGNYSYQYDYRTRRVSRTEPESGTTQIVFDGGVSITEFSASGIGSPTVEYVRGHDYGGGVGGLEYSLRGGLPSFNFYDSRGDVTTQTDASGTVTYQSAYEAFGSQTVTDGSTADRQKASTKEQDPTGLLNEGFRYRDPATGTFLSRDPLGFLDGPNMYTYVQQNPWSHFDPEGLGALIIALKVLKAVVKGGNIASAFSNVVADFKHGTRPGATMLDKVRDGIAIATEVLPASVGDVKDALGVAKSLIKDGKKVGDEAKTLAKDAKSLDSSAKTVAKDAEKKAPNPDGSKGKADHQQAVTELNKDMASKHPDATITSNKSIKEQTGIDRRPDAAAIKDNKVVEVGEVARTNKDGTIVKREQVKQDQYKRANIPSTVKKLPPPKN